MKHLILCIVLALSLFSIRVSAQTLADATICTAIKNYLLGRSGAAFLTASAKHDLIESTWPEVYCSVEGMLDSPRSFRNLVVKKVGQGKYKYSCICPTHGDKYTDCCTIFAYLGKDDKVRITHVKWDSTNTESFSELMNTSTWYTTDYSFKIPTFFTPSSNIFVDDVPGTFQRWTYDEVCVACWPSLGAWSVTDYPSVNAYLTENTLVRDITYHNGTYTIFSGYATDGRIWYMKKHIVEGRSVDHADVLVLIYPKSKQSDVKSLINVVKLW